MNKLNITVMNTSALVSEYENIFDCDCADKHEYVNQCELQPDPPTNCEYYYECEEFYCERCSQAIFQLENAC